MFPFTGLPAAGTNPMTASAVTQNMDFISASRVTVLFTVVDRDENRIAGKLHNLKYALFGMAQDTTMTRFDGTVPEAKAATNPL